ncbi:MAG TPA: oligosaccharide flippase family protein [Candidatus Dormibacteraeota bacterium]|nr:oligosaccharide flippase family protein [Candidatus Dormibacteraeota bacterium]
MDASWVRRAPARAVRGTPLLRSSATVAAGLALARLLGFAFFVVAGRTLSGESFGRMAYALNFAAVAAVLVTTSPLGLSRFLAKHRDDPHQRRVYFANWLAAVLLVLALSGIATAVVAARLDVSGWLLVGIVVNLAGVAALETYREVQRGLDRFASASVFFVAANLLQLVAIVIAAALGHPSAAFYVIAYGISGVATLIAITLVRPIGLGLSPRLVSSARIREVLRFVRPLLLHSVFYNVCFSADLLAVSRMLGSRAAGSYAAAETLAGGLLVVPMAVGFTFLPRVPHLARHELRPFLTRTLAAVTAVTLPCVAFLALWGHVLLRVLFGGRYPESARPLAVLAVGMGLYGLCSVLGSLWLGLGRPVYSTIATGLGMVAMLVTLPLMIARVGIEGGAWGFTAGAATQLLVMAAVTVARLGRERDAPGEQEGAGEPAIAVLSDALDGPSDEGYTKVTRELTRAFRARRTVSEVTLPPRTGPRVAAALARLVQPVLVARGLRTGRPGVGIVLYASRAGCTLPALVRARLLRAALPEARVVMLALQPRRLPGLRGSVARRLWPDGILAGTDEERDRLRGMGARAESVWGGVDLEVFRPARPGEKEALRRAWGLPLSDRLVLHVGHLTRGRNLEALLPLTGRPGLSVVVALSSREDPGCAPIRTLLEERGVIVLRGYRENIAELYRLADCYVFPTESTDFAIATPLSVIEAMASDLPVATTRLGALPELFAADPGVRFVDSAEDLAGAVLAQLDLRPPTRHLAEPYSWSAQALRLLELLEGAPSTVGPRRRLVPRVILARARRGLWAVDDAVRRIVFGAATGFERRPTPDERVVVVEPCPHPVETAPVVRASRVGLVSAGGREGALSVAREAADFYGLQRFEACADGAPALLVRAAEEGWPLVVVDPGEDPAAWSTGLGSHVADFAARGGTVLVAAPGPRSNPGLAALFAALGPAAPVIRPLPPSSARALRFSTADPALTAEFTGTDVETTDAACAVEVAAGVRVLASVITAEQSYPALVDYRVGAGRVIVAVGAGGADAPLRDLPVPRHALRVLPAMMVMRRLYGDLVWRPPASLAGFVVDDPALRCGWLGLSREVLAQVPDWEVHVTVATIPRELELADRATVALLAAHPTRFSACYHGNDHSGYEFYLPTARRERFRARTLEGQRSAIAQAVSRGRTFWERTGLALDRVMVFPHGLGPVEALCALQSAGFLATCNFDDRDPLGAARPADPFLGLRPAETAWSALPLLQRRGLPDHGFVYDLFLGRPAISFSHDLHDDLEPVRSRARQIDTLCGDRVHWRSLEDIARHAYLQRRAPDGAWEVLMTANEVCLHNPSAEPRVTRVRRPHLPPGWTLGAAHDGSSIAVVVPPRATATVSVAAHGTVELPSRGLPCSLFTADR